MLPGEARWLAERLFDWPADAGPVLNVGSASSDYRARVQPWIEGTLFGPARERGYTVIHLDRTPAVGVDIAGDLLAADCQRWVRDRGISGILCSSVLEHVAERAAFAAVLAGLLPEGGWMLVTAPRSFPYHPDPIDTRFRPGPVELGALFPELRVARATLLSCGRLLELVAANPSRVLRRRIGRLAPPRRRVIDWLPYLVRSFEIACVELERPRSRALATGSQT